MKPNPIEAYREEFWALHQMRIDAIVDKLYNDIEALLNALGLKELERFHKLLDEEDDRFIASRSKLKGMIQAAMTAKTTAWPGNVVKPRQGLLGCVISGAGKTAWMEQSKTYFINPPVADL